jgi:hypothetical protein
MKVKELLKVLEEEMSKDINFGEKIINCYDFKSDRVYPTPENPTFVDLSDNEYLDIVFNLNEN